MTLQILNGPIIQAGESLSDPLDCTAGQLVRLTMPGDWNYALLSFQASSDGILYNDLFDLDGREIIGHVIPGTGVLLAANFTLALAHIKFRSGTRDNPVKQTVLREFAVALDVPSP